ncbi:hypothetical protein G647_08635 [Cladophialophora carrionii CBS 160.54]|uniref:Transcriptional coactivator HFI1/ADA1 n=1 Tax=Cladophialophora carrionii CBS 160.54 TaxID=1279043 RepID=V9D3K7_9EURO|nr:uncharacterized protein G647_08635 [Cladophialophora carrionii CBS 160.54]ETI20597.1 hypothetical protein G647_08635 [Cladophialophora carrionii CBS 160.54]
MATVDDTFNPAALTRSDTVASTASNVKAPPAPAAKPKASHPRVDLEPLYTELKSLIGANWEVYFDATEHAHNSLILAIICNTGKDPPEPGLAAWVSATTDKANLASAAKPAVTSDAAEQRLKAEVMALPARERRRLKAVAGDKAEEETAVRRNPYEEYYNAGRIKAPEPGAVAGAAGGLTKTNWDLEIRKRYLQPLSLETLEFPDTNSIHARMVPICYEESVAQGCSVQCAELVNVAAEAYLKGVLSEVFNRTRSNGPRYNHSAGEGIMTKSYKKKVVFEEAEFEAGRLQKTRDDNLLPIEAQTAYARRPMGMPELQLTGQVGPLPWNSNPLLGFSITNASADYDYDQWLMERGPTKGKLTNGYTQPVDDPMDADNSSDNYGWEGVGSHDRTGLQSVLADCLEAGDGKAIIIADLFTRIQSEGNFARDVRRRIQDEANLQAGDKAASLDESPWQNEDSSMSQVRDQLRDHGSDDETTKSEQLGAADVNPPHRERHSVSLAVPHLGALPETDFANIDDFAASRDKHAEDVFRMDV